MSPHINRGEGDSECYRLFCLGRHGAFRNHGYLPEQFSAASAVGSSSGSLVAYLLASAEPGRHFENPRPNQRVPLPSPVRAASAVIC